MIVVTLTQQYEINRLRLDRVAASEIAARMDLPEPLVERVLRWLRRHKDGCGGAYFGEKRVPGGKRVRCGQCRAKLTHTPCRACRLREYISERNGTGHRARQGGSDR